MLRHEVTDGSKQGTEQLSSTGVGELIGRLPKPLSSRPLVLPLEKRNGFLQVLGATVQPGVLEAQRQHRQAMRHGQHATQKQNGGSFGVIGRLRSKL